MPHNDKSYVVVTTVGSDRPGIVADISGWILEQGGNIEDSRMSQLGGEFATLILVSGEHGLAGRLESTRDATADKYNLIVFSKPVSGEASFAGKPLLRYDLRATSMDHPGIVHQVSHLLSTHGINIVSAETRTTDAPFSAVPVFQFQMQVDVPGNLSLHKLREELRELGSRENIDLTLEAAVD